MHKLASKTKWLTLIALVITGGVAAIVAGMYTERERGPDHREAAAAAAASATATGVKPTNIAVLSTNPDMQMAQREIAAAQLAAEQAAARDSQ